jgi:hypothetical protein
MLKARRQEVNRTGSQEARNTGDHEVEARRAGGLTRPRLLDHQ